VAADLRKFPGVRAAPPADDDHCINIGSDLLSLALPFLRGIANRIKAKYMIPQIYTIRNDFIKFR
jgi:hypothetical protein